MRPMTLEQVARATNGRIHADASTVVDAVATDTRALKANGSAVLFAALRGERFDGHDHAAAAAAGGVRALLVARELDVALPQVVVSDTTRALADLAAAAQRDRAGKVVAITGSNGKTSVKALVLAILQRVGPTYANPGNRNNEIGLPLAVIDAPDDAEFAIYEMGAGLPEIVAGLQAARAVAGRLVAHRLPGGATLVDDSYNANPGSLHAAIETLASAGTPAWLVLGDMRELGGDAAALHAEAGRQARAAGIDRLYALGPLAAEAARAWGAQARVHGTHDALVEALRTDLDAAPKGLQVLVKGSRGSAMDRIVAALLASHGKGDADAA